MTNLPKAVLVLAKIADKYDENGLDAEARKFWGKNNEQENALAPKDIELYTGRGGLQLLTLADCMEARQLRDEHRKLRGGARLLFVGDAEALRNFRATLPSDSRPSPPRLRHVWGFMHVVGISSEVPYIVIGDKTADRMAAVERLQEMGNPEIFTIDEAYNALTKED